MKYKNIRKSFMVHEKYILNDNKIIIIIGTSILFRFFGSSMNYL